MPYCRGKNRARSESRSAERSGFRREPMRLLVRWSVALTLLAAVVVLCLLFPEGDQVSDLDFDAVGAVISVVEGEGGKVLGIRFQPEGGEAAYPVALSPGCRIVDPAGKVSAHQLPGRRVRLRFAAAAQFFAAEASPGADASAAVNHTTSERITTEYMASDALAAAGQDILIADVIFVESS